MLLNKLVRTCVPPLKLPQRQQIDIVVLESHSGQDRNCNSVWLLIDNVMW